LLGASAASLLASSTWPAEVLAALQSWTFSASSRTNRSANLPQYQLRHELAAVGESKDCVRLYNKHILTYTWLFLKSQSSARGLMDTMLGTVY
jgi:hypothetical protein